ncbi:MAG: hypothetical protein KDA98_02490 [Acidimicrobiales bacterium]|nr:hypothetical protein [Acidimicrobiales bacterium]
MEAMIEDWERGRSEVFEGATHADVERLLDDVAASSDATLYLGAQVVGLDPPWVAFLPGAAGRFEVLAQRADDEPILVPCREGGGAVVVVHQGTPSEIPSSQTLDLDEVRAVAAHFTDEAALDPVIEWVRRDEGPRVGS